MIIFSLLVVVVGGDVRRLIDIVVFLACHVIGTEERATDGSDTVRGSQFLAT